MLIAKLQGAQTIVLGIDKDSRRLALAKELGADLIVDTSQQDVTDTLRAHGAEGVDVVCECAGAPASLETCLQAVRKEGTLLQLGIYSRPFENDFNAIVMKELRVVGSYGYVWTSWQRTLQLLGSGKIEANQLVSHELPLRDFEEGFRLTRDGTATKVVFNPQSG